MTFVQGYLLSAKLHQGLLDCIHPSDGQMDRNNCLKIHRHSEKCALFETLWLFSQCLSSKLAHASDRTKCEITSGLLD